VSCPNYRIIIFIFKVIKKLLEQILKNKFLNIDIDFWKTIST